MNLGGVSIVRQQIVVPPQIFGELGKIIGTRAAVKVSIRVGEGCRVLATSLDLTFLRQ